MPSRQIELEQISPKDLWQGMHLRGKSQQASDLGAEILSQLPIQDFRGMRVAQRHGEIAAITEKTSLAVAKRAQSWSVAEQYLIRAGQTVVDHYPVGYTPAEARLRGDYWDPVYGQESAQRICAAHMAELYEILSTLTDSPELGALMHGLRTVLTDQTVSSREHERFDLIGIIEKPTSFYKNVRAAYEEFLKHYAFGSEVESFDQIVTVTTMVLGRAQAEGDWSTVRLCLSTLKVAVTQHPEKWKFIVSQVIKNFSLSKKAQILDSKLRDWAVGARSSQDLHEVIRQLEQLEFLGLGHGTAVKLQSAQSQLE